MRQVYAPANSAEAHMLAHLLDQNGIVARIHGEALQGGVGELPAGGLLQLLVADDDFDQARALIADWERAYVSAPDATRTKPSRPMWPGLLALVLGVGCGWLLKEAALHNAIPVDGEQVRYDSNTDGTEDLIYYYRVGATYAYKARSDLNFDGAMDLTEYFDDAGIITKREADDNFDGYVETTSTYVNGVVSRIDIDRNRNGVADIREYYRDGVISRDEIMDLHSGRVVRTNEYANFLPSRSTSDLNGDGFLETMRTYNDLGEITGTEIRTPD